MILVTGGTGFIGRALIRYLVSSGKPVRILLRPSQLTPNLPQGIPLEVAVCSIKDERALRAALKGVELIYHLAGAERAGSKADLVAVDIESTLAISAVAVQAGVARIVLLSHLGADRASAFPLLKAKAIAEGHIIHSGVSYTILNSALVFGLGDQFTVPLARLLKMIPVVFPMPGDGSSLLQPIWIEDLVTCLAWAGEDDTFRNQIISIGGVEYLTFREIMETLMSFLKIHRSIVNISPAYLRIITLWVEQMYPHFPVSSFLLDTLAVNRTASLDTLPRKFGLMPARFCTQLDYLQGVF